MSDLPTEPKRCFEVLNDMRPRNFNLFSPRNSLIFNSNQDEVLFLLQFAREIVDEVVESSEINLS